MTVVQQRATASDVDLAVEVDRLHALLDRQPSCLMRVGLDGTLLAVNDAALGLLGARGLAQALGTTLIDRIHGDAATVWADFAGRVWEAGSASVECEMRDLGGVRRAVILQAVALPAHPDGIDSLLVAGRDVSTARRLQASLREQEDLRRSAQDALREATASVQQLQARVDRLTAERDQLQAALDATRGDRDALAVALAELKSALSTAIDSTLLVQQLTGKGART
ncbi:MAG: PAS domain-containing protein [Acidobacteria bacterium]|nr:PAS domain-containing protein [Acidobacteriota bacterium]